MTPVAQAKGRFLPRLAGRVFNSPLMIEPSKLQAVLHAVSDKVGLDGAAIDVSFAEFKMPRAAVSIDEKRQRRTFDVQSGIALIDVFGTLVHRADFMDSLSGLTSYQRLTADLEDAGTDPDVRGILLTLDSAGGESSGAWDLADLVADVSKVKPVWALVDSMAFSAGYLIASQARRVLMTQGSGVGSVGVIAMHVDESERDKMQGRKFTIVHAGAHKNDLGSHGPLGESGLATLSKLVSDQGEIFAGKVARGRGMSTERVKATEAALFFGGDALNVGFADAISTFHSAFAELKEVSGGSFGAFSLNVGKPGIAAAEVQTLEVTAMSDVKTPAGVEAAQPPVAAGAGAETGKAGLTGPEILEINQLCQLAGLDLKTANEFIAAGVKPSQVREKLIDGKANAQADAGTIDASAKANEGLKPEAGFLAARMKATLIERGMIHGNR